MKNVLLLGLLLLSTAACKPEETAPNPDAAIRVAGTYTITRLITDAPGTAEDQNLALPVTNNGTTVSATFDVARVAENAVSMVFTLRVTGQGNQTQTIGNYLEIKGNELYEGSTRLGTADGTTLNLDVTNNGTRTQFEARKQ